MAESGSDFAAEEVSNGEINHGESSQESEPSSSQEYWQTSRETISERNRYMFMNTLMSDVRFSVESSAEEATTSCNATSTVQLQGAKSIIPAHKYVLGISSPVFYAMFYGDLAETDGTVSILDSSYECFVEFLRFLYYDEVEFTIDTVMGVSYLAKKYIVPALEKRCLAFVEQTVDAENVFKLLSLARSYKDDYVERICWEYLDNDTFDSIESPAFCHTDKEVVRQLLTRDTLHAKEIELFLALKRWAISQQPPDTGDNPDADSDNNDDDEDTLREGVKEVANLIRYPLMSQREFAEHVPKSGMLEHEDVINMFLKFNDTLEDDSVLPFSQVPRRGYYRCSLYSDVYGTSSHNAVWDVDESKGRNILTFSTNMNLLLCGVGLYGNDTKGDSYSFYVYVTDEDDQVLLSSEGSFTCHSNCLTYDVIFNKPVKVHKNMWYSIHATVDGPRGVYGGQCLAQETVISNVDAVTCGQVKFFFKDIGNRVGTQNMYNHFAGLLYFLH